MIAHDAALQSLDTAGKAKGTTLDTQLNAVFAKRTYIQLSDETNAMLVAYKNAAKADAAALATGDDEDSDKDPGSDEDNSKGTKRKGKPKSTKTPTKTSKPATKKKSPKTAKKKATPKKALTKKTPAKKAKLSGSHMSGNLQSLTKVFRLPCIVRTWSDNEETVKDVGLERDIIQLDQGSDFNLISDQLAIELGLVIQALPQSSFQGGALKMRTSEGRERELKEFTTFDLGVSTVWRTVQCFVLPTDITKRHSSDDVQLLLGMPWLHDANAIINIRDSSVDIGDPLRGESLERIRGPRLRFRKDHSLIMYGVDEVSIHEAMYQQSFSTQVVPNGLPNGDADSDADDEPSLQDIWHDFGISQFEMGELPNWAYFQDYEAPDVDPDFSATDSPGDQAYVDLAKFVELLKWDNGLPPMDGRPKLDDAYFNMLANWLPAPGQYEGGADALLGILLTALLDSDDAAQIFCA